MMKETDEASKQGCECQLQHLRIRYSRGPKKYDIWPPVLRNTARASGVERMKRKWRMWKFTYGERSDTSEENVYRQICITNF